MSEKHLNNTEKAIAYIAKHPGCRSPEISEAIGVPTCNVTAILSSPVQAGYVVACKVECPGKPAMNEYRISATVAEDKVSWAEFRVAKRTKATKLPQMQATPKPMRTAPPNAPQNYGPDNPPRLRKSGESLEDYRAAMGWSKATQSLDAIPPKAETPPPPPAAPEPSEALDSALTVKAWAEQALANFVPLTGGIDETAHLQGKRFQAIKLPPRFLIDHSGALDVQLPDGAQLLFTREETRALGILMKATEALWQTQ